MSSTLMLLALGIPQQHAAAAETARLQIQGAIGYDKFVCPMPLWAIHLSVFEVRDEEVQHLPAALDEVCCPGRISTIDLTPYQYEIHGQTLVITYSLTMLRIQRLRRAVLARAQAAQEFLPFMPMLTVHPGSEASLRSHIARRPLERETRSATDVLLYRSKPAVDGSRACWDRVHRVDLVGDTTQNPLAA